MCGRFTITCEKERIVPLAPDLKIKEWHAPRYNVAPSQPVPTVLNDGHRQVAWNRWGLIPSWAKDAAIGNRLINARAETLREKPSFKSSFKSRRCLIFADGFYEWKNDDVTGRRVPVLIRLKSGDPFAFAGLWDTWKDPDGKTITSCTIITTQPNDMIKPIHDRMPALLKRDDVEKWLEPGDQDLDKLQAVLSPYPAQEMECFAVTTKVNNPKFDDPACMEPAPKG